MSETAMTNCLLSSSEVEYLVYDWMNGVTCTDSNVGKKSLLLRKFEAVLARKVIFPISDFSGFYSLIVRKHIHISKAK